MYSTNRMNLLCVYKSRESRLFMKPILLKLVNTLRQNSTQESFICDIKLFGSEIGFTVNRLCFCCRNVDIFNSHDYNLVSKVFAVPC